MTSVGAPTDRFGEHQSQPGFAAQDGNGVDRALRQSVTDKDAKTAYSYDIVNRLTEARTTNSGGTQTADYQYAYDGNGNRTSQTVNGVTTSYSYNAANELISDGATTYTYDANGNQTGGRTALVYNAKDQTSSVGGTAMTYTGGNQFQRTQSGPATYTNSILGLTREGMTSYTRDPGGTLLGEPERSRILGAIPAARTALSRRSRALTVVLYQS